MMHFCKEAWCNGLISLAFDPSIKPEVLASMYM